MKRTIGKVGVVGAGVMGQGIAAHLANVGIPTLLLDVVPTELTEEERSQRLSLASPVVRNRYSAKAKANILQSKPQLLYDLSDVDLITIGNVEDDLHRLREVDWIIEVIVENLAAKRALFEQLDSIRSPGTLISSNTSGVSIRKMAEGRSAEFRKEFLGTHFFNPVRYMRLLEVIPTSDTDPELVRFMVEFGERVLGKGVVVCKDTVNFIANRIGTFGLLAAVEEMEQGGLTVDEVDAITGPVLGRPKSATFRTLDLVGLDTFAHVAANMEAHAADELERNLFALPKVIAELVSRGWTGEKTGRGFYQKTGASIRVFDHNALGYVAKSNRSFASLEAAKLQKRTVDKMKTLFAGTDEAARFAWNLTKRLLLYTAAHAFELADELVQIDRAMKWGFNWELGPFELWQALGLSQTVARMQQEGEQVPNWIIEKAASQRPVFYEELPDSTAKISLTALKKQGKKVAGNASASLVDLGDDVLLLEFHSRSQAIGDEVTLMIKQAAQEMSNNWQGLVIGNQGRHFCVGANLMQMLLEAQDENWEEIEATVRDFQQTLLQLKYLNKPVVAAPFSMNLGGGAEITFCADHVQAAAETYMGLVEAGVGLLPGGGGCKELLKRQIAPIQHLPEMDLQPFVGRAFETIAMAKVSTSAADAKKLGYLRMGDGVTVNPDHLLLDAKTAVLKLSRQAYVPPKKGLIQVVGETGFAVMKAGAYHMLQSGYISEHDYKIASQIAFVLAGGRVPAGSFVSEEYLLDLEREAFLSLLGESKTQARMQYMLTHGKPLRN